MATAETRLTAEELRDMLEFENIRSAKVRKDAARKRTLANQAERDLRTCLRNIKLIRRELKTLEA